MFLSTGCHFLLMFQFIFVSISFHYKPFIILDFFLLEVKIVFIFILLDIRNYGDVLISAILISYSFSFLMRIPVPGPVPVPVPVPVIPFRFLFWIPDISDARL